MSLQRDINPFPFLKYLINGKTVYCLRHVRKKGFMSRCKLINSFPSIRESKTVFPFIIPSFFSVQTIGANTLFFGKNIESTLIFAFLVFWCVLPAMSAHVCDCLPLLTFFLQQSLALHNMLEMFLFHFVVILPICVACA